MWMPAHTTVPPRVDRTQRGGHQCADRGEDDRRVQRLRWGTASEPPAQTAPISRANSCAAVSPGLVKANTVRPCQRATWAMMCAAAPKPYSPRRRASPAITSAR